MRFLFYYFLVGVNVILVDDNNKRKVSSIFFYRSQPTRKPFSPNISNAFSYRIWEKNSPAVPELGSWCHLGPRTLNSVFLGP
jgi:hypothetical protein